MSAIEEAESMLRMAYMDFRALTGMENREIFADEIFGFHVQMKKGFYSPKTPRPPIANSRSSRFS